MTLEQRQNLHFYSWFSKVLLLDGFITVNATVNERVGHMMNIYKSIPSFLPNMAIKMDSIVFFSKFQINEEVLHKAQLNPITTDGRIKILQGVIMSDSNIFILFLFIHYFKTPKIIYFKGILNDIPNFSINTELYRS